VSWNKICTIRSGEERGRRSRGPLTHSSASGVHRSAWIERKLIWQAATRGHINTSPAVSNGMVYVGSADNSLYALNAATRPKSPEFYGDICAD
jgi:hypothetical protein